MKVLLAVLAVSGALCFASPSAFSEDQGAASTEASDASVKKEAMAQFSFDKSSHALTCTIVDGPDQGKEVEIPGMLKFKFAKYDKQTIKISYVDNGGKLVMPTGQPAKK